MKISEHFDVAFTSIKKPTKSRCGDHLKIKFLENESVLVAMVCDGVGSRPADYLASEMVCNNWSSHFEAYQGTNYEKIKYATSKVNEELLNIEESKKGLMTTQTLALYDMVNNLIFFQNIGDSRTYVLKNNELHQMSVDDIKVVIKRDRSGKPLKTKDGFVVSETGITNTIGQHDIRINVNALTKEETSKIKGIVLVSDGFYNCPNFENDALSILNAIDMQTALNIVAKKNLDYQNDDMTVILIRQRTKNFFSKRDISSFLKSGAAEENLSNYSILEITKSLLEELESSIKSENNTEKILELLQLCDKFSIDFGRKKYIELFDSYKNTVTPDESILRILLHKMRKSKNP